MSSLRNIYMVFTEPLKFKKPPISWFKASCETLRDFLAVVWAFSCGRLTLILFLLTLSKVLKVFRLGRPWSSDLLGCLRKMAAGAMERPFSAEIEGVSQSNTKEQQALQKTAWYCCYCCCSLATKSCPTLCDPMDCSLPFSSVHGILQARILQWVAISYSRGSSEPGDQTYTSCFDKWIL